MAGIQVNRYRPMYELHLDTRACHVVEEYRLQVPTQDRMGWVAHELVQHRDVQTSQRGPLCVFAVH